MSRMSRLSIMHSRQDERSSIEQAIGGCSLVDPKQKQTEAQRTSVYSIVLILELILQVLQLLNERGSQRFRLALLLVRPHAAALPARHSGSPAERFRAAHVEDSCAIHAIDELFFDQLDHGRLAILLAVNCDPRILYLNRTTRLICRAAECPQNPPGSRKKTGYA
jgi:hypothetical protein